MESTLFVPDAGREQTPLPTFGRDCYDWDLANSARVIADERPRGFYSGMCPKRCQVELGEEPNKRQGCRSVSFSGLKKLQTQFGPVLKTCRHLADQRAVYAAPTKCKVARRGHGCVHF